LELKWFEDLISVAEKGHFARAAEDRHLTQSALSRRIKSLETWIGAELLDRSVHPIELTPAGREFIPTAKEIVSLAYDGRGRAAELARLSDTAVTMACLHTLALYFVPKRIADLRRSVGPFEVSIIAETRTIEEYLNGLQNGSTDFFICYRHSSAPFDIDEDRFPSIILGSERISPFANLANATIELSENSGSDIPYLEYSGTSFLSRVVESLLKKAPFAPRLKTVYRASLAESLCTGAQRGLGVAWLPESIARHTQNREKLDCISNEWATEFQITAFRAASNNRPVVSKIWNNLRATHVN
jgi:DNA-binding transcriptional LysR family regulator